MLSRRRFILGAAGGLGSLVVGWSFLPPRQRMSPDRPLAAVSGGWAMNGWVKVGSDGTVTVMLPRCEMGQGVMTALAMLVAEEMDADWAAIRTETAPADGIYNNIVAVVDGLPFRPDDEGPVKRAAAWVTAKVARELGVTMTGGSSSVRELWLPMREAGAAARGMLVAAAAEQWGVPAAECRTAAGWVSHPSGRSAGFGEFAEAAARRPLPARPSLKARKDFSLLGRSLPRLEAAAKLDGSARFGCDALPDGMLYASLRLCPVLGGRVASFEAAGAARLPGVRQVLAVAGYHGGTAGVAVVADSPWQAIKACEALAIKWDAGPLAEVGSADLIEQLSRTLEREEGCVYFRLGDVETALAGAAKRIEAEYRAPYLAHMTMEPMNCTVAVGAGAATVWVSTQVPTLARCAVAKVLGIAPERVELREMLVGCGFGRRLEVDYIAQAAAIAREFPGVPIQTTWSRADDTMHDFYRPACVARFKAGFDGAGRPLAWWNASAGQAIMPQVVARHLGLPWIFRDKTAAEGAFDQPYEWPHLRVGHQTVDLPVPVGYWRSVGHSHHAFFTESFLDEAAAAVGRDPLDFRLALLQRHPRHRAVLERAAALAGWRAPLGPAPDGARKARGLALHESFGSIVAQVVEASVGAAGQIRVHRVVCVIDCGFAVNPGLVRQQLEGAIVFGLSAALHGEIVIADGRVQQTSFRNQDILHMDDCPPIETDILPSDAPPAGVGEAGTPPIAPALANAWFALTGQRLRALPLKLRPDRPAFAPVAARTCPSGAAMPQLHVNGQPYEVQAEADTPLLWVLRGELKLTGTKYGCGIGYCGACTVHLDGEAVRACETRLENVCDRAVTTIEGLAGHEAEALRRAFLEEDVVQCGYCQGGQLMSACALLKRVPRPTDAQIDEAMAGNLCRCGTYPRIRAAIHRAARQLRG